MQTPDSHPVAGEGLPQEVVSSVCDGVLDTMSSICGAELTISDGPDGAPHVAIAGIIPFTLKADDTQTWSMVIGFPKQTAMALTEQFIGMELDFESADMGDMIGELVNIVAGDVVARMDAAGMKVQMGLPAMTRGADLHLLFPARLSCIQKSFTCTAGAFRVDVAGGTVGSGVSPEQS